MSEELDLTGPAPTPRPVLKDGYHDVPPGHIAAVVTYLEMRSAPALPPAQESDFHVRRVEHPDPQWYRALFRAVGEPWLWFSRLRMSDEDLVRLIYDPAIEVFALRTPAFAEAQGMLELDWRVEGEVEIAYFGVTPALIGQGAGSALMRYTLDLIWSNEPARVHLHTCTLDHPGALEFYMRWGFHAYRRAVEVAPDPRLTGDSPRGAAAQIPLITD
jgi:GNAT superfamily N-acetyltransferase